MISKWQWLWRQLTHRLWIRATLFAVAGVLAALLALSARVFMPNSFPFSIGADSVDSVLNIIASSMLAVTTFSLSVMVTAYQAATTNVTPRATQLLIQDTTSQNVLGTFIGSFLYALVGMIALSTDAYGEAGRFFLFLVTIAVIVLVVIALLRWISHLTQFGRVLDTCIRVEEATNESLQQRLQSRFLGGLEFTSDETHYNHSIEFNGSGYIQYINMKRLQEIAEQADANIQLCVLPGNFAVIGEPVAYFDKPLDDEQRSSIRESLTIDHSRSFDQDPRFGLVVLAEIASRALSPGVNDPGTAIDILGRQTRILSKFHQEPASQQPFCTRIRVKGLDRHDFLYDAFGPIVRDAANIVEVRVRLDKSLQSLEKLLSSDWQEPLKEVLNYAREYAKAELNALDYQRYRQLTE